MFTPEQFRAKAAEYAELIKGSTGASQTRDFQALEQRFTALADNEQWLADNYDKTVHGPGNQPPADVAPAVDLVPRILRAAAPGNTRSAS